MFDPKYAIDPSVANDIVKLPRPSSQQLRRIDEVCLRFEAARHSGNQATLESFLNISLAEDRDLLLESLIRSELELAEASQRAIEPSHFLERFADSRGVVLRAFVAEEELEKLDGWDTEPLTETLLEQTDVQEFNRPQRIGDYEIIEEIARGGMGIVYRARQTLLGRDVALKIIRAGVLAGEVDIARFRNESLTLGGLHHEGIVPVYDVGSDQGFHYYSMPLISGQDLAGKIANSPLPPNEIARIVRDVAIAVQFAHERGIVHRDLKPRNILIDLHGKVHVADFGLAKLVGTEQASATDELTESGQALGTPAYMAPEQAYGKANMLSDVYSLGAILYTGITGRPPHQAATSVETLRQVIDEEPVAPCRLNPSIPRDLETITLKALSKTPADRYESAKKLAAEIDRFLDGRAIEARPISAPEQFWRWSKRQPLVASLAAAVFASLAIGLLASLWMFSVARHNERNAVQNAELAVQAVKQYLTEVAENPELKELGMEGFRQQLLLNAQEFYQQLDRQATKSSTLPERQAENQFQLAFISHELGDLEEAQARYGKSSDAYRAVLQVQPQNLALQRALAKSLSNQGLVAAKLADVAGGEAKLRESIELLRKLSDQSAEPQDLVLLASAMAELGEQLSAPERAAEQHQIFDEVAQICEQFPANFDLLIQSGQAQVLLEVVDRLALNLQFRGRLDEAGKWFGREAELSKQWLALDPRNSLALYGLARGSKGLNMIFARQQKFDEGVVHFSAAQKIYRQLCDEHPLVFAYLDNLAVLTLNQGTQLVQRGDLESAEPILRQAVELHQRVVARQPQSFRTHNALGLAYSTLATTLMKRGNLSESEAVFKQGIDALSEAGRLNSEDSGVVYFAAAANVNLGDLQRLQGKFEDSIRTYQTAIAAMEPLTRTESTPPPFLVVAASAHRSLATSLWKHKELPKAEAAAVEASRLSQKLRLMAPESADFQSLEATIQVIYGEIRFAQTRLVEARSLALAANKTLDHLIESAQSPARFQVTKGELCNLLARLSLAEMRFAEAVDWCQHAIAAQAAEAELRKIGTSVEIARANKSLGNSHYQLAEAKSALGSWEEAEKACTLAINLQTDFLVEAEKLLARIQTHTQNGSVDSPISP